MATTRKQFRGELLPNPELEEKMNTRRRATEADLEAQRVSFAVGNAMHVDGITEDSVRRSSGTVRLQA